MQKNSKLKVACSVVSALAVSLTAGSTFISTNAASKVVTLKMWVHETDSPEGKLYKQEVKEFNNANKGKINVQLTAIPRTNDASGYDDKVNAAVTTNSLPDVLTCDGPNVAAEAEAGILAPINGLINKKDLADFNPDIVKQGTYNGKLYGLGCMDSSVVVYYNKDMFAKAGITAPTDVNKAWTWDQFYANAKKLTTSKCYGVDMHLDWGGEWNTYAFLPFVQSYGGSIISSNGKTTKGNLNGKASVQALTFIKKLFDNKVVSKTPVANSFELEKAAMLVSGTWEPATLKTYPKLKWGIMPYPVAYKGAKSVSPCGTWGFYMTKGCAKDKQAAAAKLIQYLTSTQACINMYNANGMPPARKSSFDKIKAYNTLPMKIVADQLQKTAEPRPLTKNYPVLSDQFSKAISNVLNGMEPKKALDAAVQQVDAQLGN